MSVISKQFHDEMRLRFDAQLNSLEKTAMSSTLLDLCFAYYLEGWYAATIPECADDFEHELNAALRQISPARLNEILGDELPNASPSKV